MNLLNAIKEGAEKAPFVMEGPESDWVPIFMYQDGHGTYRTGAIPEMTRENLAAGADGLGRLLAGAEAVQAALVLPVWLTQIQRSGVGRTERVMVTHVTRNHTRCEMATVIRSKPQPRGSVRGIVLLATSN